MSVFSKVRNFFSRHRNKFIVGGVLISGTVLLGRYAQQKLQEWQKREALEFMERNRKQQHFDSIERTCNQTIVNLTKTLNETVLKTINTDEVIEKIQNNPDNKIELWNELKVLVFTKATCSIYSTVMLVVTLKVQLSIVGGYLYKDPESLPSEMQEKYLSLCQNLMESGFVSLFEIAEEKCTRVLESVDLKKQLRVSDLEAIFWSIQTAMASDNNSPLEKLREYVLPEVPSLSGTYEKVIGDTIDLLESDEVKSISTHCIHRGFILLGEQISEFYSQNGTSPTPRLADYGESFANPYNVKKHLVKLLPIINGMFAKKIPDMFLQQLISYEKLVALSANVYESLL